MRAAEAVLCGLQAIMVEECALEGRGGIALPRLLDLVSARSTAIFDDKSEAPALHPSVVPTIRRYPTRCSPG